MENYLKTQFDLESDDLLEVFDEVPIWSAPFGLKLLEYVQLKKDITMLDIGFGAGFPLTELAMRLGNSATIYGIDPWAAGIRRTKKKIAFYGIENINIIKGVAENIPLDDNSIDLVTSNNGINNVADLPKVLSECARVMKKGGQFLHTMNLNHTMFEFYDTLEEVLKMENMTAAIEAMHAQIYEKRKPLDDFLKLVETSGFSIKEVAHDQFQYRYVDGSAMLRHYFIRLAFLNSWKTIVPANKQLSIFKKVEQKMNEKAAVAGGFTLTVPFVLIDSIKK